MSFLVVAIASLVAAAALAATQRRLTVALLGLCVFAAAFIWNLEVEEHWPPSIALWLAAVWVMLPWAVGVSIGRGIAVERDRR